MLPFSGQIQTNPSFGLGSSVRRELLPSQNIKIPPHQLCLGTAGHWGGCRTPQGLWASQKERQFAFRQVAMCKNGNDSLLLVQKTISCSGISTASVPSKPTTGFQPWTLCQTLSMINTIQTKMPFETHDTYMLPMSCATHPWKMILILSHSVLKLRHLALSWLRFL